LGVLSFIVAKKRSENPIKNITEHIGIAIIVIIITKLISIFI